MNDTPEPQLRPLLDGSGNSVRQSDNERMSLTPKLVMATAVMAACLGGVIWNKSSSTSAPPSSSLTSAMQAEQPNAEPQIRPDAMHFDTQFALVPTDKAASALASTGFDEQQRAQILAAVKNRRMRLVRMPIAQVSGAIGQSVAITSGGLRQNLVLKPDLQSVVLPIYLAGEVTIDPLTPPPTGGLGTGILTTLGPQILPLITSLNQQIVLDVIVQ
ncbi:MULTISPECIES: hypothetical protein [unclassified Asaia]|uniref:hypothetical protein n=1 Tax=unclassified Asaia TaxID=2685023 RepID=UPI000F8ED886|nr:hypothetical protein [Asaia sp. W19]